MSARGAVPAAWNLLDSEPGTEITVDLSEQTAQAKDLTFGFAIDCYTR